MPFFPFVKSDPLRMARVLRAALHAFILLNAVSGGWTMAATGNCTEAASELTTPTHNSMRHMFDARPTTGAHPLLRQGAPPFSFRFGGRPSASFLPNWKRTATSREVDGRVEHELVLADPESGLEAVATLTLFKGYPAAEWVVSYENKGTGDSPMLEDVQALDMSIVPTRTGELVRLHYLEGDTYGERSFHPMRRDIGTSESVRAGQSEGRSSSGAFPFFNLQAGDLGFIAAIGWTGNWTYVIERDGAGAVRMRAGMEHTHLVLHPGERIRTPRIMLMAWQGDRADAHNLWRRLMLEHCSPYVKGQLPRLPVAIQCFDRYVNSRPEWATEKGQLDYVEAAHRIGCDSVWLDAT